MKRIAKKFRVILALSLVMMMSISLIAPSKALDQEVDMTSGMTDLSVTNGDIGDPPDGDNEQQPVVILYDMETTCFDYGQLVTKLHITLNKPIGEVSEEEVKEAFSVVVKNYKRNFYGIVFDGDYDREVTGASIGEDGRTLTLELKSLYADSIIGGANYAMFSDGYEVTLKNDLGDLKAEGAVFEYSGVTFDPEADKWLAVEETETTYNYRYFDPTTAGYSIPKNGFPIVVWLHGAGESGSSNNYDNNIQLTANRVTAWGQAEAQDLFGGAYVIAPQTSRNVRNWTANGVVATIEAFIDMVGEENVDRNRIYIGGCSMGGMGTWTVIKAYPDYFAAAFPICANTTLNSAQIAALKELPIYLIHSVDDTTVNISGSINAYNTLTAAGKDNIYLAFYEHVVFEGLGEGELGPGHWSWVYVHNDFDGEGDDEVYWLDEYTYGGTTYETTKPSELGFSSFKAWLAGQAKVPDGGVYDMETTCFDYGQLVTKLHITLNKPIGEVSEEEVKEAFSVVVKNYKRDFYGTSFEGDYEREVTGVSISEDGKTIVLELKSRYADSIIGGANYAMFSDGYEVTLKNDLGALKAEGAVFEYSGVTFDPEADKWLAVEETETTYNFRYFDPRTAGYTKPKGGFPIIVWLHGGGESGSSNNFDNNIQLTANRVTAWGQAATQDLFGGAYVIAPQTSRNVRSWTADGVVATIELFIDLVGESNVNRNRIYIGGCSMGGGGTWTTIKAYPDYFAAAFPICAGSTFTDEEAKALKDLPIYYIYSIDDPVVNVNGIISAYNTLRAAGNDSIYLALFEHVIFDGLEEGELGVGHWSWVYVHNDFDGEGDDEIYWLDTYVHTDEKAYETTKPSELGFSSFKAWLAAQKITPTPPYYPPYTPPATGDEDTEEGPEEVTPLPFDDVSGHWAEDYIRRVYEAGLLLGTSANRFSPDMAVTRAMFVTVLGRLAGVDPDDYGNTSGFDDVKEGWYSGYVAWAVENGIVKGRSEKIFDPDSDITREEMAAMIYRYLRFINMDIEGTDDEQVFSDIDLVSDWAREAVEQLQRIGLFEGRSGNRFDPKATAIRAELATVMTRLLDLLEEPK